MWWQQGFASNKKKKSNNNKNFIKKSKIKEHQSWEIFLSISRIEPNAAYMKAAYFLPKKEKKKKAAYSDTLNNAWPILENIKARLWHRNPSACTHRWLVHTFSRQTTNFKFFFKKNHNNVHKNKHPSKSCKSKMVSSTTNLHIPQSEMKTVPSQKLKWKLQSRFPRHRYLFKDFDQQKLHNRESKYESSDNNNINNNFRSELQCALQTTSFFYLKYKYSLQSTRNIIECAQHNKIRPISIHGLKMQEIKK